MPTSIKGEGREENGKRKGRDGKGEEKGRGGKEGKGRTPVPDCESAKVATLKCGGPPTMPKENRGPWSKKFENRCYNAHDVTDLFLPHSWRFFLIITRCCCCCCDKFSQLAVQT